MLIVRAGWSGEDPNTGQWDKVAVELNTTDLRQLVVSAGLPEELASTLPVMTAYELLTAEARWRLLTALADQPGRDRQQTQECIADLSRRKAEIIESLRAVPAAA